MARPSPSPERQPRSQPEPPEGMAAGHREQQAERRRGQQSVRTATQGRIGGRCHSWLSILICEAPPPDLPTALPSIVCSTSAHGRPGPCAHTHREVADLKVGTTPATQWSAWVRREGSQQSAGGRDGAHRRTHRTREEFVFCLAKQDLALPSFRSAGPSATAAGRGAAVRARARHRQPVFLLLVLVALFFVLSFRVDLAGNARQLLVRFLLFLERLSQQILCVLIPKQVGPRCQLYRKRRSRSVGPSVPRR